MSDTNDPFSTPSPDAVPSDSTPSESTTAGSTPSAPSASDTSAYGSAASYSAGATPDASGFSGDAAEPTVPLAPSAPPSPVAASTADPSASGRTAPDPYVHRFDDQPTASQPASGQPPQWGAPFSAPVASAPRPARRRRLVAGLALAAVAGGAGFGGAWAYDAVNDDSTSGGPVVSSLDTPASTKSAPDGAVETVAQKVLPSVVQINVRGADEGGSGTGIIISSDGDILTNDHVVEPAGDGGQITVAFSDGTNVPAKIVGQDPVTDIAIVRAEGVSGLTPAALGTSSDLKVGQAVVAIGSPFGLESTVTQGIISALNRPVESSDGSGGEARVFPAVQTDAAINPGNSGGPLVDLQGRVIGINSAIRSGGTSSDTAGSIGLGFAIPVDLAKNVAKQLLAGQEVQHARIGVTVAPATGSDQITGIGAEVREVTSGGAGDKAGIKAGDVITALNGNAISSSNALVATIRGYQPGDKVTLTVQRDGKSSKVEVTLESDGGQPAG